MKRPGSAACHAADIVGRGIRSERLCYAAAKRLTGANGDRGGHPDEAALHPGGETANASKPLKITVVAAIRRPQLRRLGLFQLCRKFAATGSKGLSGIRSDEATERPTCEKVPPRSAEHSEVKIWNQRPIVVNHHVLELQPHHRIPVFKCFQRHEFVPTVVNRRFYRFNVLEIES